MRVLLLLITIYCSVFSANKFKETRYVDAFGIEQYRYGTIDIFEDTLILAYTKPKEETLSYESDKLVIKNGLEIKEYKFDQYPKLEFMGLFLKAIMSDNYLSIESLFQIEIKNETITLIGKPVIYNTIEYIEITKKKSIIKKIILKMTNKDIITIETIN